VYIHITTQFHIYSAYVLVRSFSVHVHSAYISASMCIRILTTGNIEHGSICTQCVHLDDVRSAYT